MISGRLQSTPHSRASYPVHHIWQNLSSSGYLNLCIGAGVGELFSRGDNAEAPEAGSGGPEECQSGGINLITGPFHVQL